MMCSDVREYLFAFLDNELDAALSIEVQRHLERCGRCAREVEIERAIRKSLAAKLADHRASPMPDAAVLLRSGGKPGEGVASSQTFLRLHRRGLVLTTAAAMLLLGAVAWLWPSPDAAGTKADPFADLVVADFQHFVDDGLSVQFASAKSEAVGDWLAVNTGLAVSMPAGVSAECLLIGARKCTIAGRPAAFAMYRIGGVPASLVATDAAGLEMVGMKKVQRHGRSHWLDRCKGHTVIACRRGDLVYAAVSTLPEEQLACLTMDPTHEGD